MISQDEHVCSGFACSIRRIRFKRVVLGRRGFQSIAINLILSDLHKLWVATAFLAISSRRNVPDVSLWKNGFGFAMLLSTRVEAAIFTDGGESRAFPSPENVYHLAIPLPYDNH